MSQRLEYLTQILDKIGSPLMAAIIDAAAKSPDKQDAEGEALQDAQAMAGLLSRSVQMSIDLARTMDFQAVGEDAESLRVALTALAAQLLAGQFRHNGRLPAEADLKRVLTALQAVLTFSENFTPAAETVTRLKNLAAKGEAIDSDQLQLQYINAFIPAVSAVAAFPFGQPEKKLILDVAGRLTQKAEMLSGSLFPSRPSGDEKKLMQLGVLRALAQIYGECHAAETDRIMGMDEQKRTQLVQENGGVLPLTPVWNAFEARAAMLEALAGPMIGGEAGTGSGPSPAAQKSPEAPAAAAPPVGPPARTAPPAVPPPQQPSAQSAGQNPMSMFAKPKDAEAPPQAQMPPSEVQAHMAPPPTAPQEAQAPAETPPPQAPVTPPQAPPAQQQGGGNPMAFFKSPPKKEGEE